MDGWFRALDAHTGKNPLAVMPDSVLNIGAPMTFTVDGKQYVAVYSGIGGWMGAVALPSVSTDDPYAALGVVGAMKEIKSATQSGGTVYVFSF